ncbi:MAG: hypothetical protein ACRCV0_01440 [Brevinema sp.]
MKQIMLLINAIIFLSISCSVSPKNNDNENNPIDFSNQFKQNIAGNYRTVDTVLSLGGIDFQLKGGNGLRISSADTKITLSNTADTELIFSFVEANNTLSAGYDVNDILVSITVDGSHNLLINDTIVATFVPASTYDLYLERIQGGYVSCYNTVTNQASTFTLDKYHHTTVDTNAHIYLLSDKNQPIDFKFVQVLDQTNALYSFIDPADNIQKEVIISILNNGDIYINGVKIARRIQSNADDFMQYAFKFYVTQDVTIDLNNERLTVQKYDVLYLDPDKNFILRTDKGNVEFSFNRALHANEAIFNVYYNNTSNKESITIENGISMVLNGKVIAKAANPAIENSFKQNISYRSYSSTAVTNFTVSYWGGQPLNLLEGEVFEITEDNLDIRLRTTTEEIIWKYAFAFSETEAVYQYNENQYIIIVIDPVLRQIKASADRIQTIIAQDAKAYFVELFTRSLTDQRWTIITPSFTFNGVQYTLPLISFSASNTNINISDANNNRLSLVFDRIIDETSAIYTVTTKEGTVRNVIVTYRDRNLWVNNNNIATHTTNLSMFNRNFIGRYHEPLDPRKESGYAFISETDEGKLHIFKDFGSGYTVDFRLQAVDPKNPNTKATFFVNVFYQGNEITKERSIPEDIIRKISTVFNIGNDRSSAKKVDLSYSGTDFSIYLHEDKDKKILMTKISNL